MNNENIVLDQNMIIKTQNNKEKKLKEIFLSNTLYTVPYRSKFQSSCFLELNEKFR